MTKERHKRVADKKRVQKTLKKVRENRKLKTKNELAMKSILLQAKQILKTY